MSDPITNTQVTPSPSIQIITAALQQVEEVMVKAEQSEKLLDQNLTQVRSQRIGLNAQRQMLVELKNRISNAEQTVAKPESTKPVDNTQTN